MRTAANKSYTDRLFTLADLESYLNGDKLADDQPEHFEVVEGKVVEMSPTNSEHGLTGVNIISLLNSFVRSNKLGRILTLETGFKLKTEPLTVRCPDVAFVGKDRLIERSGYIDGSPDLAVEIISPGNTAAEMLDKVTEYIAAGTKLVWLVYPRQQEVRVYRAAEPHYYQALRKEDVITGEDVIPGFSCRVAEFFE